MSTPDASLPDDVVLLAFGEVALRLDSSRCIRYIAGAVESVLHTSGSALSGLRWSALLTHAMPQARDGLYWAVEAVLEGYVPLRFLPARLPFTHQYTAQLARLANGDLAIRFQYGAFPEFDALFGTSLRLSLTSITGFADVLLKGIGGPLTDIQIDDLNVIFRDGQFALRLIEDLRAQMILPALSAPVPIDARTLLELGPDDVSHKRLANQNLALHYDIPAEVTVYSNGAIHAALVWLVQALIQTASRQSAILITARKAVEVLEIAVTYHPADMAMKALRRTEPIDLFDRQAIKQASQLLTVVSSLHAWLTSYGCTAWASPAPDNKLSVITMTVPLWNGPTSHPNL